MRRVIVLFGLSLASAFASPRRSSDPLRRTSPTILGLRPSYGDNPLRVWSTIAPPEIAALKGLDSAR